METEMLIFVGIIVFLMLLAFKWFYDGGLYYRRYPGAKLMDDMAKTDSLDKVQMENIIHRVGNADDPHAEVAKLRKELNVPQ